MVKVLFIEHNGAEHAVDAAEGESLMQAAVNNSVPGIDADCGGSCACATCHVYVEDRWLGKLPPMQVMEESMLSMSTDRCDNSRLSCQIKLSEELDGLTVTTPEFQY